MTELAPKSPPHNEEAEQSLLGALLIDSNAIFKVADSLVHKHFWHPKHQVIFQAISSLFSKQKPIDVITLTDQLRKTKQLKSAGGASYLAELVAKTSSSANIASYKEIIKNNYILRNLISAGGKISELGFEEGKNPDALLDEAEKTLFALSQDYLLDAFVPIKSVLSETFERIDELQNTKGEMRGIRSGFKELDNLLAGMQNSDLIIIAARPAMGKTSFALNIASHIGLKEKKPVGIFSLEQSKDQLIDRMIAGEAQIDSWKLRTGNLNDEDFPRLGHAMSVLSEAPIYIDDSPLLNVMQMRVKARRLQAEHGLGILIIDYLQLIDSMTRGRSDNRVQEISEISRSLKALARELNIPVVALSQLSRAVEMRQPKIPQLADLRESGSIEQDADVVMFIYREDYYESESERKNIADIMIKKHRHGPIGNIELYFKPEYMKFTTISKDLA